RADVEQRRQPLPVNRDLLSSAATGDVERHAAVGCETQRSHYSERTLDRDGIGARDYVAGLEPRLRRIRSIAHVHDEHTEIADVEGVGESRVQAREIRTG